MKKLTLVAFVAALMATLFLSPAAPPATAGVGACDPQQSRLCNGLSEYWPLSDSNGVQFGSFANSALYEPDAVDIPPGYGGDSLAFDGSTMYLTSQRWGSMPSYFTVAAWVRIHTGSANRQILSNHGTGGGSFMIRTNNDATPKLCAYSYNDEGKGTPAYVYTCTTSSVSLNAWHLLVVSVSPYGPYGGASICLSVDAGTATCSTLTYNAKPSQGDLIVGALQGTSQFFDGDLKRLGIWSRAWEADDITAYYNSGTPLGFPFY